MINATNMPVNSNEFYFIIFKLNCIKKQYEDNRKSSAKRIPGYERF